MRRWVTAILAWAGFQVLAFVGLGLLADHWHISTPPAPEGVIVMGLIVALPIGVLVFVWPRFGKGFSREGVVRLLVVVSVFAVTLLLAQSEMLGLRRDGESIVFATAATIVIAFLYTRFARKFNL